MYPTEGKKKEEKIPKKLRLTRCRREKKMENEHPFAYYQPRKSGGLF